MPGNQPLLTIGIPTYNRVMQLGRAIETALNQDYNNIEVIVSDNASTDETESFCRQYCASEARLKYIRQAENLGPTANFTAVLKAASGDYFMWLGDDDWLDTGYAGSCARELSSDPKLALVSGIPEYYQEGTKTHTGKCFSLLHDSGWRRVAEYYAKVADNGMFYGLMRTAHIRQFEINNMMGGDWHIIAGIAFTGKVKVLPEIHVHRELGGASASYRKIRDILGLSKIGSIFPRLSIAVNVWKDIAVTNPAYTSQGRLKRFTAGTLVFLVLIIKTLLHYSAATLRWLVYVASRLVNKLHPFNGKQAVHAADRAECMPGEEQCSPPEHPEREQ
jgi:glycosyltransferase involved in cell wall biosynthesis